MCGLFAAKTKKALVELAQHNMHRGSRTHSVTGIKGGQLYVNRYDGEFSADNVPDGYDFYICHVQAPTSAHAKSHPAVVVRSEGRRNFASCVWHNGILKDDYMKKQRYDWDTRHIADTFPQSLDEYDGTFACFYYALRELSVFRNEISPLFMSEDGDAFSSTRTIITPDALEPNKVFNIDLTSFKMSLVREFKTVENPYFFL
ncbi:hypothetical protein VPHK567_0162 [Vibrio phage K567]|nr:hypothetical protein MYOV011v1_p0048 [Vibrio phage 6E35.1a]